MKLGGNRTPSWPAVVAAIALVALLSFSGLAGAVTNAVSSHKAKKIAKKVVKKQAPKLSVLNAANLGGQPPSAYLDRVAQATSGADAVIDVPGPGAFEILGPVSLDVPQGVRFVRVDGTASFEGNPNLGISTIWFTQDGACARTGFGWDNHSYTENEFQQFGFHLATEVTPGSHQFRLCASANLPAKARARTLLVETVASGAGG